MIYSRYGKSVISPLFLSPLEPAPPAEAQSSDLHQNIGRCSHNVLPQTKTQDSHNNGHHIYCENRGHSHRSPMRVTISIKSNLCSYCFATQHIISKKQYSCAPMTLQYSKSPTVYFIVLLHTLDG